MCRRAPRRHGAREERDQAEDDRHRARARSDPSAARRTAASPSRGGSRRRPASPTTTPSAEQPQPFRHDQAEDAPAVAAERHAGCRSPCAAAPPGTRARRRYRPPRGTARCRRTAIASSIGVRRLTSDSSTRCCIGLTAKNGSSGSIAVTCSRIAADDRRRIARRARRPASCRARRSARTGSSRRRPVPSRSARSVRMLPTTPTTVKQCVFGPGPLVSSCADVRLPHPPADRIPSLPETLAPAARRR